MRKSIVRCGILPGEAWGRLRLPPPPIVSMSFQPAIPWWVALQQCPPPLRQPWTILTEKRLFEYEKSLNGECANRSLSQWRGSPHARVPKLCPRFAFLAVVDGLAKQEFSNLQTVRGPRKFESLSLRHVSALSACCTKLGNHVRRYNIRKDSK